MESGDWLEKILGRSVGVTWSKLGETGLSQLLAATSISQLPTAIRRNRRSSWHLLGQTERQRDSASWRRRHVGPLLQQDQNMWTTKDEGILPLQEITEVCSDS